MREKGFTLIEMLLAMVIFALLLTVVYGALGLAGRGFIDLQKQRDQYEKGAWMGRQLHMDMAYVSPTHDQSVQPMRVTSDVRGDVFDELWLVVREAGKPSLTQVHYFIDEEKSILIRESYMLNARSGVKHMRWTMAEIQSFDVEILGKNGRWLQRLASTLNFIWPRALRITIRDKKGDRQWYFPIIIEE